MDRLLTSKGLLYLALVVAIIYMSQHFEYLRNGYKAITEAFWR